MLNEKIEELKKEIEERKMENEKTTELNNQMEEERVRIQSELDSIEVVKDLTDGNRKERK